MLKNLNAGIIRRLAANGLKSDKKRNLFLIITIAFSACLMLTLSLKILGENTKVNRYMRGRYQTVFNDLSEQEIRSPGKAGGRGFRQEKGSVYTADKGLYPECGVCRSIGGKPADLREYNG